MEVTYRVLGTDGKEYGPVTQPQLQSWINEGRLLPDTQVSRSDDGPWRQANQFAELAWPSAAPVTAARTSSPPPSAPAPARPEAAVALEHQLRSGASWFYWIAGLSAVNTVIALTRGGGFFVVGLGFTLLLDVFVGPPVSTVLDFAVIGIFVLFGVFAQRRQLWAFVAGIVLYGADALIFLKVGDWLAIGFHGLALWGLCSGLRAALASKKIANPT